MSITQLLHLKNASNIELSKQLEGDITYSVLFRILQNDCTDIFYNEGVIICYSNPPYPIWVWNNRQLLLRCKKYRYNHFVKCGIEQNK